MVKLSSRQEALLRAAAVFYSVECWEKDERSIVVLFRLGLMRSVGLAESRGNVEVTPEGRKVLDKWNGSISSTPPQ